MQIFTYLSLFSLFYYRFPEQSSDDVRHHFIWLKSDYIIYIISCEKQKEKKILTIQNKFVNYFFPSRKK